jgi:NAD(P)H-dependent flavin oxidoreductase YrpB (nitropropane dioxygenase family)
MADWRSRVAALALGADGINMGTRFIATKAAAAASAQAADPVARRLICLSETLDPRSQLDLQ